MNAVVRRWGNGAAVRIPATVMQAARLRVDQAVEVRAEGGRIVIEPLSARAYDAAALIAAITEANRHDPIACGRPVGRERDRELW